MAQATSHHELMRALVDQARVVADKATHAHTAAHETLAAARCAYAAAINNVNIAATDESQCIAELNAANMDTAAAAKSQLALGAQALFESVTRAYANAVHALSALRKRTTNANDPDNAKGSVRTHGMMATPRSMSLLSTTPTVTMAKVTVTPRLILPAPFRWAASLLHHETTAAIRNIVVVATGKDIPRNVPGATTPRINRQAAVASALKMLLDVGIVTPLQAFHACIVDNAQDRCIAKAAVEPQLKQAALRIAAVVDAERPANHGPKFFFFFSSLNASLSCFCVM
jgi:hypothetical protein